MAVLGVALLTAGDGPASAATPAARTYALDGTFGLVLKNVVAEAKEHEGRKAVRITEAPGVQGETIALLPDSEFEDGTLEVELAGRPAGTAPEASRGFPTPTSPGTACARSSRGSTSRTWIWSPGPGPACASWSRALPRASSCTGPSNRRSS